jgi:hypothetical protein
MTWKSQAIYSKYVTGGGGAWDVISDVEGGTDAGHAAIHTTARVSQKNKK